MPIYEYVCEKCRHHLEIMQKMDDAPLTRCPKCGKKGLEKIFSQTSFQLKGGGWHVSDYGKPGGGKKEKDSGSESKESKDKKETAAA
jgi:putative FmdB family regulatory protein